MPSPGRFIADAYFRYACSKAAAAGTDAWPGMPGLEPAAAALAPCKPASPMPDPAGEDREASEAKDAKAGSEPAPAKPANWFLRRFLRPAPTATAMATGVGPP